MHPLDLPASDPTQGINFFRCKLQKEQLIWEQCASVWDPQECVRKTSGMAEQCEAAKQLMKASGASVEKMADGGQVLLV